MVSPLLTHNLFVTDDHRHARSDKDDATDGVALQANEPARIYLTLLKG